ncbi:MAG: hypothetical protein OES84_04685, partial [Kiritimatiellaceae bacterium]|nr:hypothetical protein [Kiritimatiellaceae bacterium]
MKKQKRPTITGIIDLLAIGLAIATVFGFLGRLHWFLDLFSHFRVQYMQLCLPLIGLALWKQMTRRAGALVILAAINYALVLPFYFGKPDPATEKPIRAMLMNINAGNGNTKHVLEAIQQAKPDLLLLEEVTPKWVTELKVLKQDYKYRIVEPREDCFGIMLLSKVPLEHRDIIEIGAASVPSIVAEAHFPQGVVSIIGPHPLPPAGADYSNHRNNQLAALPALVKKQNYPVLLIGDLNTTPWSSHFQTMEKESGLKNSMKGFGFQPSWRGNAFLKIR